MRSAPFTYTSTTEGTAADPRIAGSGNVTASGRRLKSVPQWTPPSRRPLLQPPAVETTSPSRRLLEVPRPVPAHGCFAAAQDRARAQPHRYSHATSPPSSSKAVHAATTSAASVREPYRSYCSDKDGIAGASGKSRGGESAISRPRKKRRGNGERDALSRRVNLRAQTCNGPHRYKAFPVVLEKLRAAGTDLQLPAGLRSSGATRPELLSIALTDSRCAMPLTSAANKSGVSWANAGTDTIPRQSATSDVKSLAAE